MLPVYSFVFERAVFVENNILFSILNWFMNSFRNQNTYLSTYDSKNYFHHLLK